MKKKLTGELNSLNILTNILLCGAVIALIHGLAGGRLLTSPLLTCAVFAVFWIIFTFRMWPWMRSRFPQSDYPADMRWIYIGIAGVLMTVSVWVGRAILRGDYDYHMQYTLQLLNGSVSGHSSYKGEVGFYPPLSHTLIALTTHFTRLSVHHAYLLLSALVALLIPHFSYRLAKQIGFSPGPGIFFTCLISLYGGFGRIVWRMFHLYLPAAQISMPFISRNLSFLIFLMFLILCYNAFRAGRFSRAQSIHTGVLIGLLGLTHPQGLITAVLFLLVLYITLFRKRLFKREHILQIIIPVFTGCLITSLYFIPTVLNIHRSGGMVELTPLDEMFPASFWLYGLLPVLAGCVFFKKENRKNWMWPALFILAGVPVFRLLLGQFFSVQRWIVFRIHRFGPYLFIFIALFAAAGCESLCNFGKKIRFAVIVIMVLHVLVGYATSFIYLNEYREILIVNIMKDFSMAKVFPRTGIEKLRYRVPDPRATIMAPHRVARLVASEAGLHIPYTNNPQVLTNDFYKRTMSQERRRYLVESFYDDLKERRLRSDILSVFSADAFLSTNSKLDKRHPILEKASSVTMKNKTWFLYIVKTE